MRSTLTIKLCFVLVGLVALVWSAAVLPVAKVYADLESVGYKIPFAYGFKTQVLSELAPAAERAITDPDCHTSAKRSAVLLKLRMFEVAVTETDPRQSDARSDELKKAVLSSLSCSPYDPFFWFVRYWLEVRDSGLTQNAIRFLELSYSTGPNEGWVAIRRNRFALAVCPALPRELQEKILGEFALMVDSGFIQEAVANLTGPGWSIRDEIVSRLSVIKQINRERFADALQVQGINLKLPGLENRKARYRD